MTDMPEEKGTVRWGIIGAGNIAKNALAPALRNSGVSQLCAVASRDGERAKTLADEFRKTLEDDDG